MHKLSTELILARTCYKHLAGELGVAVTRALLHRGCITDAGVQQQHCFAITTKGREWCERYGVDEYLRAVSSGMSKNSGRDLSQSCMDHSHRTPHLAGVFGRAVLSFMCAREYCRSIGNRRLLVTGQGVAFLHTALGIEWTEAQKGGRHGA